MKQDPDDGETNQHEKHRPAESRPIPKERGSQYGCDQQQRPIPLLRFQVDGGRILPFHLFFTDVAQELAVIPTLLIGALVLDLAG